MKKDIKIEKLAAVAAAKDKALRQLAHENEKLRAELVARYDAGFRAGVELAPRGKETQELRDELERVRGYWHASVTEAAQVLAERDDRIRNALDALNDGDANGAMMILYEGAKGGE